MLLRDGVTATDEARRSPTRVSHARAAASAGRRRSNGLARDGRSEYGTRCCARCGVLFERTPTRWLTCQRCYLANSEVDFLASRAALSLSWTRPPRVGHES
jgi:hypothetical protein